MVRKFTFIKIYNSRCERFIIYSENLLLAYSSIPNIFSLSTGEDTILFTEQEGEEAKGLLVFLLIVVSGKKCFHQKNLLLFSNPHSYLFELNIS
jgi:hypothetical protein